MLVQAKHAQLTKQIPIYMYMYVKLNITAVFISKSCGKVGCVLWTEEHK